jgi:hypothetical protein
MIHNVLQYVSRCKFFFFGGKKIIINRTISIGLSNRKVESPNNKQNNINRSFHGNGKT